MKKVFGDYYVGLDIGTSSVGWAVTDKEYKLLKFNGKHMWGVRVFEDAQTAEKRRQYRSARRRTNRRRQRIDLLQELFGEEIAKVDENFYLRLKESKYWPEDKWESENQPNTLFNDENYKDKDFHNKYKTIYHLRAALANGDEEALKDPRLVYLACHHIIKNRGHFLFSGELNAILNSISEELNDMSQLVSDEYQVEFVCRDINCFEETICDKSKSISEKKTIFKDIFSNDGESKEEKKQQKALAELLAGSKKSIKEIIGEESLENDVKICFSDSSFEDNISEYDSILGEKFIPILKLKSIYDWGVLSQILGGYKFISEAKVHVFEKHKEDLALLKGVIKDIAPEKYNSMFRDTDKTGNYCSYVGSTVLNGKKLNVKACKYEDFQKFVKKTIEHGKDKDPRVGAVLNELESRTFMPKQVTKDNGVIPNQVHKSELIKILKNASEYLPFLNHDDGYGTVMEKIVSILTFRIPYYVGPLNLSHSEKGFCWAEKRTDEKVTPWKFDEIVDKGKSAENFIRRMTRKCTYLPWADVLPKSSITYQKYMVLNELNNLRIDDEKLPVELKQEIFNELFRKQKKVTNKNIIDFCKNRGYCGADDECRISGIDGTFKASMSSYVAINNVVGEGNISENDMEEIIKLSTIFGDEKDMLLEKLYEKFSDQLNDEDIKGLKGLTFTGWGNLSKEFLTEINGVNPETGEIENIIQALFNRQDNLGALFSKTNGFDKAVEKMNIEKMGVREGKISYERIEEMYLSPAVKRSVWQTMLILKEIKKITGKDPKKVFVEVTRDSKEKKPTQSRKKELEDIYEKAKKDVLEWDRCGVIESLKSKSDEELRQQKLYLWYSQLGRCMYSGETIKLEDLLYSNKDYDIDHIYPQSKIDDDSIRSNKVLVKKKYNADKSDKYPLNPEWQSKQYYFWKMLKDNKLISGEKFYRLVRNTELSEEELSNFVARQLVETSQSVKAVADLVKENFPQSDVVYVKAKNVTKFRQGVDDTVWSTKENEAMKERINQRRNENVFIKSRRINDHHHAKDAYLNIVVGNVMHIKYTTNPRIFLKDVMKRGEFEKHSIRAIYKYKAERNGQVAWIPHDDTNEGTMEAVKSQMRINDVRFTRQAYVKKHGQNGGFYDQNIVKASEGLQPIKGSDERLLNTARYGGYKTVTPAYFILAQYTDKKGKKVKRIDTVPLYLKNEMDDIENMNRYIGEIAKANNLHDPKILIGEIKFGTLFEINGFRGHLMGSNEKRLFFRNSNQLILSEELVAYVKKLENFSERKFNDKDSMITEFDGITNEKNKLLYREFQEKLVNTVYAEKLGAQADTLEKLKDNFEHLSIEEQAMILLEIVDMFACIAKGADLSSMDGGSNSGQNITIGRDVTKVKYLKIINQSSTGLFENRTNISEL